MGLDLDRIRRTIAEAPATGTAATVDRNFLEQVLTEISAGRLAQARLSQHVAMEQVQQQLGQGAQR